MQGNDEYRIYCRTFAEVISGQPPTVAKGAEDNRTAAVVAVPTQDAKARQPTLRTAADLKGEVDRLLK